MTKVRRRFLRIKHLPKDVYFRTPKRYGDITYFVAELTTVKDAKTMVSALNRCMKEGIIS